MSDFRASRVFTVSFPDDLASQVEELAREESRNISDLFRAAFRTYRLDKIHRKLAATREAVATRAIPVYSEQNIEKLVDEIRGELTVSPKHPA